MSTKTMNWLIYVRKLVNYIEFDDFAVEVTITNISCPTLCYQNIIKKIIYLYAFLSDRL